MRAGPYLVLFAGDSESLLETSEDPATTLLASESDSSNTGLGQKRPEEAARKEVAAKAAACISLRRASACDYPA